MLAHDPTTIWSEHEVERTVADAARLYEVRMHGGDGESVKDGNRIDGILTLDLPRIRDSHEALRLRVDELERDRDGLWDKLADTQVAEDEATQARERAEGLLRDTVAALERYGKHEAGCAYADVHEGFPDWVGCSCGLDGVLVRVETEEPPKGDYHYLCCACGEISPHADWKLLKWDEERENLIPVDRGDGDPICRCPRCGHDHEDTDDNPGVYDGTRAEMEAERARIAADPVWADAWSGVACPAGDEPGEETRDLECAVRNLIEAEDALRAELSRPFSPSRRAIGHNLLDARDAALRRLRFVLAGSPGEETTEAPKDQGGDSADALRPVAIPTEEAQS